MSMLRSVHLESSVLEKVEKVGYQDKEKTIFYLLVQEVLMGNGGKLRKAHREAFLTST